MKKIAPDIGGFSGFFPFPEGYREPVLVSSTDGVGTKLKIAFASGKHNTVGIDLVAMVVNDIVVTGAKPLFFLDYIATSKIDVDVLEEVLKGVVKGCELAGCRLIGGETAELPGFYRSGEYDLVGFGVGIVEKDRIIDGKKAKPGDAIIGLASSGLHSNGYSLARKIIFEMLGMGVFEELPNGRKIWEELLEPTKIYVKPVLKLIEEMEVKALAHITGGGMVENIPRVLPKGLKAVIEKGSWEIPFIFRFLQEEGEVDEAEMFRVFNLGIGMVVVVDERLVEKALKILEGEGEKAYVIGHIEEGEGVELV